MSRSLSVQKAPLSLSSPRMLRPRLAYQSEAELEREFIKLLRSQAYEYLTIPSEAHLIANLRLQIEALNSIAFTDDEWQRFFTEKIAGANDGIVEKTVRVQEDHVQVLKRDDGSTKNVDANRQEEYP